MVTDPIKINQSQPIVSCSSQQTCRNFWRTRLCSLKISLKVHCWPIMWLYRTANRRRTYTCSCTWRIWPRKTKRAAALQMSSPATRSCLQPPWSPTGAALAGWVAWSSLVWRCLLNLSWLFDLHVKRIKRTWCKFRVWCCINSCMFKRVLVSVKWSS